ncbi:uncharacterized protein LOC121389093 [Gigantopelta aegis]|uniref:uncharacterized protein LOC121389093 n=1 Tax=Gigantopelta aegis TaxID=1735272 RepID=UPI001B88AB2B|nr:uncharacterized protein LOC121389093 [Gigantopelta aegis]
MAKSNKDCLSYRDTLDTSVRLRYDNKLKLIDGNDPYELKNWSDNVDILPGITYMDIVNYLLFTPSAYTADDLKSYKGLDAYNQFVCGWVRERTAIGFEEQVLVTAKVLHSQRLREKPLRPWVISHKDGVVKGTHCTCMAGLGEACTHIAALLFSIEATVRIRNSATVTERPAYWMLPAAIKNVPYSQLTDINFTSAKGLKRKLDDNIDQIYETPQASTSAVCSKLLPPSPHELDTLFKELHSTGTKPVLLATIEPYSNWYIPKPITSSFPQMLTDLKDDSCMNMEYTKLLELCVNIKVQTSPDQAKEVEIATRTQSQSKLWYRFRAGRITALNAKSACNTNVLNPAKSLVKTICYPESSTFSNEATRWGCKHEKTAKADLLEKMAPFHENLKIEDSGFIISTDFPHLGASPDGVVSCDCCGKFCLEIKCPFSVRENSLDKCCDPKFFLGKNDNGIIQLKRDHAYFYQVQTQLGVTSLGTCFFVVWTKCDLHVELITFDPELWQVICSKTHCLFQRAILPELVGKYYSRMTTDNALIPSNTTTDTQGQCSTSEETWCYCDQVESGFMICCDNENCDIQWFHYLCIGMEKAPRGKWFLQRMSEIASIC